MYYREIRNKKKEIQKKILLSKAVLTTEQI